METAECSKALLLSEAMLDPLQTSSPVPAVMTPHCEGEEGEWRTSPWELMQLVVRLLFGVNGPANIEITPLREPSQSDQGSEFSQ